MQYCLQVWCRYKFLSGNDWNESNHLPVSIKTNVDFAKRYPVVITDEVSTLVPYSIIVDCLVGCPTF